MVRAMSTSFRVRPVELVDFPRWLPLWDGYNAFYGRHGATALSPAITQATWHRFFDPGEPVRAVVADDGRDLIGIAHYLFHRSTISIAPTCYLQDLFTSEAARGRGVASRLVERVCEAARHVGSARVYWQTHETNATARALYDKIAERSGFIVYRIAL
jgi:GNAT superfamily N-acetyltransferase